jgi:hypothetical protein
VNADRIREARDAQPFRPFLLRMADGTCYTVPRPDFLFIPPGHPRTVLVYTTTTNPDHCRSHWLDVGLIGALAVES